MEKQSDNAANFVRQLAELSYRLAAKDIVVSSLHIDWSSFGSWELQAQRDTDAARYAEELRASDPLRALGPEIVRVFWDGRDGVLTVQASPTRSCSAPNEWNDVCAKGFELTGDEMLRFAEEYLTKRLGEKPA